MTGHITETRLEVLRVEWKIEDFLSLNGSVGSFYKSSKFRFESSTFYLVANPFGTDKCKDSIGLYLHRFDSSPPATVIFDLGIKKADGSVFTMRPRVFKFVGNGFGWTTVMKRSELLLKKAEFLPSDAVTFTCILRSGRPVEGLKRFSPDFEDLLVSSAHSDVTVEMQRKKFKAHKSVLSARSPVFAAAFHHDMSEKSSGVINIKDCDPDAFTYFLRFLYTDRTDINMSNVFDLYRIADKYLVEDLKSYCVAFLLENLSAENVCDIFAFDLKYGCDNLKYVCRSLFSEQFKKIVLSPKWSTFMRENHLAANELLKYHAENL